MKMPDAKSGWAPYPLPANVDCSGRMHLNQKMAKQLIKLLKRFVDTGSIST